MKSYQEIHDSACAAGSKTYIDPESGLTVFTKLYHLERGACCESGCRHCPYGFTPANPAGGGSGSAASAAGKNKRLPR